MAEKNGKGLAREGHAKYDEQVWAGLIDDPARMADLAKARIPAKLGPMGHRPTPAEDTATTASGVQAP
ncbi:MAG TPA: hypothetical protein VKA83_09080 [Methylomirabilota bacterium]|nr:hypothetical protein [Methylomirabilota bacterium]